MTYLADDDQELRDWFRDLPAEVYENDYVWAFDKAVTVFELGAGNRLDTDPPTRIGNPAKIESPDQYVKSLNARMATAKRNSEKPGTVIAYQSLLDLFDDVRWAGSVWEQGWSVGLRSFSFGDNEMFVGARLDRPAVNGDSWEEPTWQFISVLDALQELARFVDSYQATNAMDRDSEKS